MVGHAPFTRTVVVHDIAETQRALLHSHTPKVRRHSTVIAHTLTRAAMLPAGSEGDERVRSKVRALTQTRQDVAFRAGRSRITSSGWRAQAPPTPSRPTNLSPQPTPPGARSPPRPAPTGPSGGPDRVTHPRSLSAGPSRPRRGRRPASHHVRRRAWRPRAAR